MLDKIYDACLKSIIAHMKDGPRMHLVFTMPHGYSHSIYLKPLLENMKPKHKVLSSITEAAFVGTIRNNGELISGVLQEYDDHVLVIQDGGQYLLFSHTMNGLIVNPFMREFLREGVIHKVYPTMSMKYTSKCTLWITMRPSDNLDLLTGLVEVVELGKDDLKEISDEFRARWG